MPDVPPPPPPPGPPGGPPPSGPPSGYPGYPGQQPPLPQHPQAPQSYPSYPGYPPQQPQQSWPPQGSWPTQPGHPGGPPPSGPPQWGTPSPAPKRGRKGLVVGAVVAAVLLIGAAVGGVVVLRGDDEPTSATATDDPTEQASEPTEDPTEDPTATESTETEPTEPTEEPTEEPTDDETGGTDPGTAPFGGGEAPTTPPPAPDPELEGGLKAEEFANDWDFRLNGVELFAKYQDGVDHGSCAPAERNGRLTAIGCVDATEWTYRAAKGDLALSHLVLEMRSPKAATKAIQREQITESRWKLRPQSLLSGAPGVYKAQAKGQFVVLTVVTYRAPAKAAQAEKYLRYANTDIALALGFRF